MSDGRVVIEVELDTSKARGQYGNFGNDISNDLGKIEQSGKKASVSIMSIAKAIGLVKVAGVVFNTLKNSMDAAISRFDTFQRFPKVMEALGYSTEQSDKTMRQLSAGIEGLPTKLDEVVNTTQRMTAMTGNLSKSTQATLALNNAFLASGASASDAQRGTDQYMQQLAKGKVDLESWKTLQETMSVGLNRTANAMGFLGNNAARDLYDALKTGEVTFRDFQEQIIKLGTGTGELAQLAQINSEGIATSFSNLHNTASKGIANVIDALNDLSLAVTNKSIAQNIDSMKHMINNSFDVITKVIRGSEPVVKLFAVSIDGTYQAVKFLSPALIGLATAYAALKIIQTVSSWQSKHTDLLLRAVESGKNLTVATNTQMAAEVTKMGVQKGGMAITAANNGLIKVSTLLYGVMTGSISAGSAATIIMTTVTTAFSAALKVAMGPIGWVAAGIGLLTTAGITLYKWITKETEASKELNAEQGILADSTRELASATEQASASRKDNLNYMESNKKAYLDLAQSTIELSNQENKSAGDKKLLKDNVDQLNAAFADLNLQYDKETGQLSMTTEQIKERISAYQAQESINETQQQLVNITQEQYDIESKMLDLQAKRIEWNINLENGTVKAKEHAEAVAALDEEEKKLTETNTALGEEFSRVSEIQIEAANRVADAMESGVNRQVISYENLSESQQSTVEKMRETFTSLQESATNAFDKISTDSETSLWEMAENMKHNQKVVAEWGENQASLLKWAGENGYNNFIPFIESMGIDQAGVLAEMVKGVDSSNADHAAVLVDLAKTYEDGFGTAGESAKDALSFGLEGLPEEVRDMIVTPMGSLNEEVKDVFDGIGQSVSESLIGAIELGKEPVIEKSKELIDSMIPVDGVEELRASWVDLGASGPEKMVEGIDSNKDLAVEASKQLALETLTSAKVALDSHSPSREFVQIGEDVVNGFVLGIEQGNEKVKAAAEQMVKLFSTSSLAINKETDATMKAYLATMTSTMEKSSKVIADTTNKMDATFKSFHQSLSNQNSTTMTNYNNVLNNGMIKAASSIDSNTKKMNSSFASFNQSLASQSSTSMTNYNNTLSVGMARAATSVQSSNTKMKASFESFNQSLATQNTASMMKYNEVLNSGMNLSVRTVDQSNNKIKLSFTQMGEVISSRSEEAIDSMVSSFESGTGQAVISVNSMKNRMTTAINGLKSNFYSAGYNASLGVASGINAGSGAAIAAANSLANQISNTLKNAMKINSPSKRMRDEVGRSIPQGVAAGIEKDAHYVDESLEAMADSMVKPFSLGKLKQFVPKISGLMNGNLTPESAFGVDRKLFNSQQANQVTNHTKTIDNSSSPVITIEKIENYTDNDIPTTLEQAAWIFNRDRRRLNFE